MGVIDALDSTSSEAYKSAESYVKTSKRYYELKVFQQLAMVYSNGLSMTIYGGFWTIGLIFLATGTAVALNTYLESKFIGYFIVALSFFVLATIFYVGRKQIEKWVIHKLSENFFD